MAVRPSDSDCVIVDDDGVGLAVSSDIGKEGPPGAIVRPLCPVLGDNGFGIDSSHSCNSPEALVVGKGPPGKDERDQQRPKSEPDMSFEAPQLQVIRICF